MPFPVACIAAATWRRKGQNAAIPFVGAYDAIPSLVHVYEPARCTLSAYTGGALVRLRRDSDDAESDFSHVSASDPELDVAAIAAWLAGSAGYIVSIYDQVSGDTITQAAQAAQPLFVASIQNGHAGGRLDGTAHFLRGTFTLGGALSQPFSYYAVAAMDAAAVNDGNYHNLVDGSTVARAVLYQNTTTDPDSWAMSAGTALVGGASDALWNLWSALFNAGASQLWLNGAVEAGPGNAAGGNPVGITLGANNTGGTLWDGDIVAFAVADPSHSDAQRGAMQTAMNAYWGVY